jgi:hypothetical protein
MTIVTIGLDRITMFFIVLNSRKMEKIGPRWMRRVDSSYLTNKTHTEIEYSRLFLKYPIV